MNTIDNGSKNIHEVLNSALQDGELTKQSHSILVQNLDTLTTLGAQGISPSELLEDRITLFIPIIDCSGSRSYEADLMRSEYNKMIGALRGSKMSDTILVSTWLFNSDVHLLHGFLSLEDAEELTEFNYDPNGLTALYDAVLDVFTSSVAYAKTLLDQGYRVKVVIVVLTDGEENNSTTDSKKVRTVTEDLLKQEIYVLALIAFGSGYAISTAQSIGFPNENVIEYGRGEKELRNAFSLVSSSVIRQSQTQIGSSSSFFN